MFKSKNIICNSRQSIVLNYFRGLQKIDDFQKAKAEANSEKITKLLLAIVITIFNTRTLFIIS